jgi:hypothetical protein
MLRLSSFIQSPLSFKLLLAEALLRLSGVSILIHVVPRRYCLNQLVRNSEQRVPRRLRLLHATDRNARAFEQTVDPVGVFNDHTNAARAQDICKAVVIAARYVPGSTCLVKSIAGRAMLRRIGRVTELKIGVLKNSSDFHAHAWLEDEDLVLLGGEIKQYTQLATLSPISREP